MNSAYFSVFDLFFTQWIMAILSKGCKVDGFQSHGSLKLSFTSIQVLYLNFVECKFFLESNSPDILALCEKLGWLNWFWQFLNEGFLPLHRKDFATHAWSCSSCEGRTSFCTRLNSRKLCRFLCMFSNGFTSLNVLLLFPLNHFLGLYAQFLILFHQTYMRFSQWTSCIYVFVFAWYEEVPPIIQGFRVSPFGLSRSYCAKGLNPSSTVNSPQWSSHFLYFFQTSRFCKTLLTRLPQWDTR